MTGSDFRILRPERSVVVWGISFGLWILLAFITSMSIRQLYRAKGNVMPFGEALALECSQVVPYAPLTPLVLGLALRYPVGKSNWVRRSILYLAAGVAFCLAHITMRGVTPYGMWDPKTRAWYSAAWDYQAHRIKFRWPVFEDLFFMNIVDDITGTFVPIALVAHMLSYYSNLRDRERRAAELEAQLTKANLQALKSRLQPHFLFNTMHSISGLMLTDTHSADAMMTRLSELLRMSLDDGAEDLTTLTRELEFVSAYLDIEKMRFGERLAVVLDIAPETLDALVPHLFLQPLVENAVQHGVAQLISSGVIQISSRLEGDSLFVRIRDNGPGLDQFNGSRRKVGIGIGSSRDRLRTLYGDHQSLTFSTPSGGGTEAVIRIPFQQAFDPRSRACP